MRKFYLDREWQKEPSDMSVLFYDPEFERQRVTLSEDTLLYCIRVGMLWSLVE